MRASLALLLAVVLAAPALSGCAQQLPGFGDRARGPGGLAADYLRPGYAHVEVVILVESGAEPNAQAVADAEPVLRDAIGKPVEITVQSGLRAKGEGGVYTVDDLRALEREARTRWTGGDTAVIHALYLAGRFEDNLTIGLAYAGSSLAFFMGTIRDASAEDGCTLPVLEVNRCAAPERRYVERSVLVHEVGHLLGLVNHGIPMVRDHEDPDHPGHSRNPESVMYWQVGHPEDVEAFFESGDDIPYRFDAHDLEDLRAFARG